MSARDSTYGAPSGMPWYIFNGDFHMQQNRLYFLTGALAVIVIALGAYIWHEQTKPKGVELRIDDSGVSIQQK